MNKSSASRNKTITLSEKELQLYSKSLLKISNSISISQILNRVINENLFEIMDYLPVKFIDVLIIDPPYNLSKNFNSIKFSGKSIQEYAEWVDSFISKIVRMLKPTASIYVCSEWKSSTSIHIVLDKYFIVRNRITWEREKGRGSKSNWKNNSEDIWYCTMSNDYTFDFESVKLVKKVVAPYREKDGKPKDWEEDGNFRLTYPSNLWTDISVPFWSMPENTDHPTQKPEKLIAKMLLASSKPGDLVFDPFLGSGTTAVVASKLKRNFVGVELDKKFACYALKRIELSKNYDKIQGFSDGVFWERNTSHSFRGKTISKINSDK